MDRWMNRLTVIDPSGDWCLKSVCGGNFATYCHRKPARDGCKCRKTIFNENQVDGPKLLGKIVVKRQAVVRRSTNRISETKARTQKAL